MKKIILTLVSLVCLTLNAQTFELKYNDNLLNDGDVVEIRSAENVLGDWKMKFHFKVTNISSETYSMRMKKEVISEAANSSNTMCWDQCMSPEDEYATCASIAPGETQTTAYGELWANCFGDGVKGTTIVNYTVMTSNKNDPKINVEVHYMFDPENPAGSVEIRKAEDKLTVSATNGVVRIISGEEKAMPLYDISGRLVKIVPLIQGENLVYDLTPGLYIIDNKKVVL